jgi:F0F1-type ATP synthase membrane subunit b/b'
MHQLNFATYIPQIFWFLVSFCAFYAFVSTYFVPKINEIIEIKAKKIADDAKKAGDILLEIQKIDAEIQAKLKHTQEIITQMKHDANREIEAFQRETDEKFALEAKDIMSKAKIDIDSEMNQLYSEFNQVSDEVTKKISDKIGYKIPIIENNSLN